MNVYNFELNLPKNMDTNIVKLYNGRKTGYFDTSKIQNLLEYLLSFHSKAVSTLEAHEA